MRPGETAFASRVRAFRDQLERACSDTGRGRGHREPQSREGALLEALEAMLKEDLDVEARHIEMDALLCAYAPEAARADMFASVRRWYS